MDAQTDKAASGVAAAISGLTEQLKGRVIGQSDAVEQLVIALLAGGHVLLEGAPGLAKTRLARLIADSIEGDFKRIQFTPDLLPSDLVGSAIYVAAEQRFEFQRGPVFANFVLADEINRAPAKVQSALLEAMEERQVTSGDQTHALAWPFFVIATQNPVEHEGTWDLPQAQLDRFLMQVNVDFPKAENERAILDLAMEEATSGGLDVGQAISQSELRTAQEEVAALHVSELIRDYVVRLIAGTRNDPDPLAGVGEHLACPASPRGTINLTRAAQARAWLNGRDHVLPEDVSALAIPVLRHRIMLTYRADADGVAKDGIIQALLDQTDVV
ncbi:MAG: MoxR family ATPase [Pseudomonadota bacterium]